MSVLLKVCTFNVRTECDPAPNSMEERAPFLFQLIREEKPDLIGFQEVSNGWRRKIREELTDLYLMEGCGREEDYQGEGTVVAYRKDSFEVLESRNFWLSLTPNEPGSRYGFDQSLCPRITTLVRLKAHKAKTPFRFYNTHLDHEGKTARLLGAVQILQDISLHQEPFILTGDMNAYPDAPEIELFSHFKNAKDCTASLGNTFHDYNRPGNTGKIDYIFSDLPCDETKSYMLTPEPVGGTFVSDHWPVFSFIEIQ